MDSSGASFTPMGNEQRQAQATTTTTSSGMTAPIINLAPIQDTTTLPVFGNQTENSSRTRIEGMEALEEQGSEDPDSLISAEELSFYSASENAQGDDNIWGLLSGVGGNIYEW